jgi:hypothetical protein
MKFLASAVVFLAVMVWGLSSSWAQCSPSTSTIGAHRGSTVEVMCRGDAVCYNNQCYGRCGPGCNWSILGNAYTSACTSHDSCIKTQTCSYGRSGATAQANCVGLLPAAIGSFANSAWYNGTNWVRDTATSVWTSIRRIL